MRKLLAVVVLVTVTSVVMVPDTEAFVGFTITTGTAEVAVEPESIAPPPPTLMDYTYSALGVPYVWGGTTMSGFDCSGLVQWAYHQIGVSVPRTTQGLRATLYSVSELQPGDVLFFLNDSHVGIYIGFNSFIHAPDVGDVVKISHLDNYWLSVYGGAGRP